MATYIKGVTDYIPVLEPFKPDYKFLSDVLSVRQDRYDTNFKALNNLYSKVVYAPLTRDDMKERREQYSNRISNGLKQVSGLDLSLQQNVDVAKGIFKPFFEDKQLITDMAFTKQYQNQVNVGNRLKAEGDEKYWDIGMQGLQMQLEKFKNAPLEDIRAQGMPDYIANPNLYQKSFDALKESGLKIKQTTLEGDWIVTTQNGTALTNHITGYERDAKTGKLILDDNKEPIPIITNPAADYLQNTVMQDPSVRQAYLLEAQVKAYNYGKENAQKFGSVQAAEMDWYRTTIEKFANEETKKLVNDMAIYNQAAQADENWKEWAKRNNVVPGSSAEEALVISAYNLNIAKANKDATEQRLKEVKQPTDDINKLKNIAFAAWMGGNMAPKMMSAAKAYSLVDAERTLKANPFKQLERQHQFQVARMGYQHKLDMAKMNQKFLYDMALKEAENASNAANVDLFSGVKVKQGDEKISGSPMDIYNMFSSNDEVEAQQYQTLNKTSLQLFETISSTLPSNFIGFGGYQGNGQYKYTVHNSQYPNGKEVTGSAADMFNQLDPVMVTDELIDELYENQTGNLSKEDIRNQYEGFNQANVQELDKLVNGVINMFETTSPDANDAPYIKLQDGSVVSVNFPTLSQTEEGAKTALQIGRLIESINMQKDMIIKANAAQNEVYTNINNKVTAEQLAQGKLSVSTGASGKDIETGEYLQEKPGVVLTEGEIELYNQGLLPYQVNFAMSNGNVDQPILDTKGKPQTRLLGREEYANMFANIMYGSEYDRAQMANQFKNTGSRDKDDYDFWMRAKNAGAGDGLFNTLFRDDYEYLRYDYWYFDGGGGGGATFASPTTGVVGSYGGPSRPSGPRGFKFNREAALEDGRKFYDDFVSNMRSVSTNENANDLELTFDRRAFIRGLPEFGDQILENQYVSSYDVAAPNAQTIPMMKDLINVFYNVPPADLKITTGDARAQTFESIKENANVRKFLDYAFDDLAKGTGLTDKTQSRFFVTDTYVEKAGGVNQPDNEPVAARYLRFSPEFLQERKTFIDKIDKNLFKQLTEGVTLMYPSSEDNNPYASKNQIINQVATIIRNEGKYESPFIPNGGSFTIYQNSNGQYIAESYMYGVDQKTGNIVPDKPVAFPIFGIDEKQLDDQKMNMQQKLYEISLTNLQQQKKIQQSLNK